ncbi:spore wall synthesis complex protein [Georgenia halophila]|uniref:Spore wall synthesis complex protein n=1 Tax=Georgenia halophila TaxID=620889 RepID=A0ABP8L7M9_9MICO
MPLSEYEQRMLQQMEQQLSSDDPKLANTLADKPRPSVRRLSIGVLLFLVGLGALVGGVATEFVWLGVLGFLAMLGGVMLAITGPRKARPDGVRRPGGGASPSSGGFMQRQEDKWQRRNEERGR